MERSEKNEKACNLLYLVGVGGLYTSLMLIVLHFLHKYLLSLAIEIENEVGRESRASHTNDLYSTGKMEK
jgi:hypothetical protein